MGIDSRNEGIPGERPRTPFAPVVESEGPYAVQCQRVNPLRPRRPYSRRQGFPTRRMELTHGVKLTMFVAANIRAGQWGRDGEQDDGRGVSDQCKSGKLLGGDSAPD